MWRMGNQAVSYVWRCTIPLMRCTSFPRLSRFGGIVWWLVWARGATYLGLSFSPTCFVFSWILLLLRLLMQSLCRWVNIALSVNHQFWTIKNNLITRKFQFNLIIKTFYCCFKKASEKSAAFGNVLPFIVSHKNHKRCIYRSLFTDMYHYVFSPE